MAISALFAFAGCEAVDATAPPPSPPADLATLGKPTRHQERIPPRSPVLANLPLPDPGSATTLAAIHEARESPNGWEIGPLRRIPDGPLKGEGLITDEEGINALFAAIDALPIVDQARLMFNRFASTLLEMDVDADGIPEPVFVTVEFPLFGEVIRDRIDPLSGQHERLVFEGGSWKRAITANRLVEISMDDDLVETASHVYVNEGTIDAPKAGILLEETKTVEIWHRSWSGPDVDPSLPVIAKIRVNYVTGTSVKETYGLHPRPIETVDDRHITQFVLDSDGLVQSSLVLENGREPGDFQRPLIDRLLEPVLGEPRFRNTTQEGGDLASLRHRNYRMIQRREDLLQNSSRVIELDLANHGRVLSEKLEENLPEVGTISIENRFQYLDEFHHGQVPHQSERRTGESGATILSKSATTNYDPLTRRLRARVEEYHGATTNQTWDTRWESPIEITSDTRKTAVTFDRRGLTFESETTSIPDGELVSSAEGAFDREANAWQINRRTWLQPEVLLSEEVITRSPAGFELSREGAGGLITKPEYSPDGREVAARTFHQPPNQPSILTRHEDIVQWDAAGRTSRVQTFIGGEAHDAFEIKRDPDGRLVEDGIRSYPGLSTKTIREFDGNSNRLVRSVIYQNETPRSTFVPAEPVSRPDGTFELPVEVTPAWGQKRTDYFEINGTSTPLRTVYPGGELSVVTERLPGAGLPRITQRRDADGTPLEESEFSPAASSANDFRLDLIDRYKLGSGGNRRLIERRALIRGTDIPLYSETDGARIYYDLNSLEDAPRYEVDLTQTSGVETDLDGRLINHVTRLFKAQRTTWEGEPALMVQSVDLRGFFGLLTHQDIYHPSGALLETEVRRLPTGNRPAMTGPELFAAAAALPPERTIRYQFDGQPAGEATKPRRIEIRESPPVSRQPDDAPVDPVLSRILSDPEEVQQTAYLPDLQSPLTAWKTSRPALGEDRPSTLEYFDGRDLPALVVSSKQNARGADAERVAYNLAPPSPASWIRHELPAGTNELELALSAGDLTNCHFLVLSARANLDMARPSLLVRDEAGVEVLVTTPHGDGAVRYWPGDGETTQWLPDPLHPRAAASVRTAFPEALVVSVPDLGSAGLDIASVSKVTLVVRHGDPIVLEHTSIQRLATGAPLPASKSPRSSGVHTIVQSSGLRTVSPAPSNLPAADLPEDEEFRNDPYWNAEVRFQGRTIAKVRPRREASMYPVLLVQDPSFPQPTPLYALVAENGEFLEYYHQELGNNARVYTIANGLRPPKAEIFRPNIIEDEGSPSTFATGENYQIQVPLSRTNPVHNRVASSIFKLGADRIGQLLTPDGDADTPHPSSKLLHQADLQARAIENLPTIAESLLPFRTTPWPPDEEHHGDCANEPFPAPTAAVSWLETRQAPRETTSLLPTSPGTRQEPFVNTEEQGRLLQAAIRAGALETASRALDFYWDKSRAGKVPLHTSYQLRTGASLHLEPRYRRASESQQTSAAQLSIAEAALDFAQATGDVNALRLGRELLKITLTRFRAPERHDGQPRGISTYAFEAPRERLGIRLWSKPKVYSLDTNARVLLALEQARALNKTLTTNTSDWLGTAAVPTVMELQEWLRTFILPYAEKSGVVPNGLFEIQDQHGGTSALAISRWTSAQGWLSFLEAADAIGVPREQTRSWLDNLARVHGATVGDTWGLDWSVAMNRPEAISPDLTAHFLHTARLLEHHSAAMFARERLSALGAGSGDILPKVVTTISPEGRLPTGQNSSVFPLRDESGWPATWTPYRHLLPLSEAAGTQRISAATPSSHRDVAAFLKAAGWFYLSILFVAIAWWIVRAYRLRSIDRSGTVDQLVSSPVMAAAEQRWAERVVGVITPDEAPHSRYANGPVEGNFIMQLRAIYKLVFEWRRLENEREEEDPDLIGQEDDPWLNGADEFASMVAIYMRSVIKAGLKDGLPREDILESAEDSNHIWSRLVLYFSEYYSGLLTLLQLYREAETPKDQREINQQIFFLLNAAGMRQRKTPFDTRQLFAYPADSSAFDLLIVQKPGVTLHEIISSCHERLGIPERQFRGFVKRFQDFKRRERPYPVHPLVLEAAKVLPHFLLVGLLGVLWYNDEIGGLPVLPYLKEAMSELLTLQSLIWAIPLAIGYGLGIAAYYLKFLRYEAGMRPARPLRNILLPLRNLIRKPHYILPLIKPGRRWDPTWYERSGYILRGIGFAIIGVELLGIPTPSFAVFMILKGMVALLLMVEAAAIFVPLISTWLSMWLQERVIRGRRPWRITRFLNQLNIPATRPASVVWNSVAYHYEISVPSGSPSALVRATLLYFLYAGVFLFAGGYVFKEVLGVWFAETYQMGRDVRLVIGSFVFFNTMYLLRFGLFVLLSGIAAAIATYPLRISAGLLAAAVGLGMLFSAGLADEVSSRPGLTWFVALLLLALALFEEQVVGGLRKIIRGSSPSRRSEESRRKAFEDYRQDPSRTLGVVYMSGDELGYRKLTPDLLMDRVEVLRERLASGGLHALNRMLGEPSDEQLRQSFQCLSDLETSADTTLWHPSQLVVRGEEPAIPEALGLNLPVENIDARSSLLEAWHTRRWLVSMMSSAGHSQDTAINLVDIALRISREGLSERTVFYLIQNKYDARDDNRPGQLAYDAGELGQREKLTRLLAWASPGSRAFSLNDWTPFGFKAGGMMGMDLVPEEALKLTNMVVLDRNATVHDLDALMEDITTVITDPGVVNVIPGRGTTNTLTPIGQGSQAMEEGHRELMKGVMLMGGEAGESVGTGWGNIQAIYYGRTQRAMMDGNTHRLPLTTRMRRGSTFVDRLEGMVGFGPHAVGISEDIWAVIQASHNALSLGIRVKFKRSRAMWHKIRETWSHADWFSAFPRWSGGFLQMMQDPLMQRINDNGPLSVFAKEMRANNGRFFLCAPFALLSILIMPLAIILDASPFVQILIVLWNFGFIMNQVLTSLGLVATLESAGFSRASALLGAVATAGATLAAGSLSPPACAIATVAGGIAGGFIAGLGRWLYNRGRDIILFGPQLVIFALGQFVRQSLEFILSGAAAEDAKGVNMAFRSSVGPREDRPLASYANPINLRSVVWIIGGLSVGLNLFALANLDFLNVVLLLPSLLFGVSCLAGPFLMRPKTGRSLGAWIFLPKLLGWAAAFALLTLVAGLVARGNLSEFIGYGLAILLAGGLAFSALRFARFPAHLRRNHRRLVRELRLQDGGPAGKADASELATRLLANAQNPDAVRSTLAESGLPASATESVSASVKRAASLLEKPARAEQGPTTRLTRVGCEFRRSFGLGITTLFWFLLVPVPGLLIFTAGSYQAALSLGVFLNAMAIIVTAVLAAALLGLLVERGIHLGPGRLGLHARMQSAYQRFATQNLPDYRRSHVFALFTDLNTYLDQRAYAYARRTLGEIEAHLGNPS